MRNVFTLFCWLLIFSVTSESYSQGFLEKMAKKASEKVEKKAEEKAEKKMGEKIDGEPDIIEDSLTHDDSEQLKQHSKDRDEQRMKAMMKKMGMSSEPVPIAEKYRFVSKMTVHFQNFDNNGTVKDEGDFVTYISPGEKNFAYEFVSGVPDNRRGPEKGIFIMDYENGATIILSNEDGKRTGVVYGIKFSEDELKEEREGYENESEDESDIHYIKPDFKKTGRTRDILGYKCEEYVFDEEDEKGSFWVTKKTGWRNKDVISSIFSSSMYMHGIDGGMLMESESTDKETGEKSKMKVTELNDDANVTFIPSDYELTNFGSMNFDQEKMGGESE
jgi:hypothetical protein